MTVQNVMTEIRNLSVEEKLELLRTLTHTLRDEWHPPPRAGSPVSRVRGLLKPDGPTPTDAEVMDAYTDYLMEKYSRCARYSTQM